MAILKQSDLTAAELPLQEFREHLRLGTGFGENTLQDPVLESFLRAAIAAVEAQTAKISVARSMTYSLPRWTHSEAQTLPVAPVLAVQSVSFVAPDGTSTDLDTALWHLQGDDAVPQIVSLSGTLPQPPATAVIEVTFAAGFGAWDEVPGDLRQAVLLLAAHFYENRSATQLKAGCMPFGVTALLEPYRLRRVGFGGAQ